MKKAAKKDSNQKDIEKALEKIGAEIFDTSQLKNACDLIACYRGKSFFMEIKNPEYAPKTKSIETKLTEGERKFKDRIERTGVMVHLVTSMEQAIKIISEWE